MPEVDDPATLRRPRDGGRPAPSPLRRPRDGGRPAPSPLPRRSLLLGAGGLTGLAATGYTLTALAAGNEAELATSATVPATTSALPAAPPASASAAGSGTATGTASATGTPVAAKTSVAAGLKLAAGLKPALLISRATHGRTDALEAEVARVGMSKWLASQLAPASIADPDGDAVRRLFPHLDYSTATVHSKLPSGDWGLMSELATAHLAQAAWSKRQLLEVMVDFWSNLLNVTCPSSEVWDTRHRYDRDVIRTNAMGRFADLLPASAFHPSMLAYLNNAGSTSDEPNENYARESLELHTVGLGARYTEADVRNAALLLTGWQVKDGVASYDPSRHYVGKVRIMGFTSENSKASSGVTAQKAYLSYLARHPVTARNIARKLAIRFVSDTPSEALVKQLAAVYTANDTAVVPVLKALFSSEEFAGSAGKKVRRPYESIVATLRAIGVKPPKTAKGINDLYWSMPGTGHTPLAWAPPNGYPDVASAWQSPAAALNLFNQNLQIVNGWWPSTLGLPGPKKLLSTTPGTRTAVVDAVAGKLLGRAATTAEKSAAAALLEGAKLGTSFRSGSWEQTQTVALVAGLFLSSPTHLLR